MTRAPLEEERQWQEGIEVDLHDDDEPPPPVSDDSSPESEEEMHPPRRAITDIRWTPAHTMIANQEVDALAAEAATEAFWRPVATRQEWAQRTWIPQIQFGARMPFADDVATFTRIDILVANVNHLPPQPLVGYPARQLARQAEIRTVQRDTIRQIAQAVRRRERARAELRRMSPREMIIERTWEGHQAQQAPEQVQSPPVCSCTIETTGRRLNLESLVVFTISGRSNGGAAPGVQAAVPVGAGSRILLESSVAILANLCCCRRSRRCCPRPRRLPDSGADCPRTVAADLAVEWRLLRSRLLLFFAFGGRTSAARGAQSPPMASFEGGTTVSTLVVLRLLEAGTVLPERRTGSAHDFCTCGDRRADIEGGCLGGCLGGAPSSQIRGNSPKLRWTASTEAAFWKGVVKASESQPERLACRRVSRYAPLHHGGQNSGPVVDRRYLRPSPTAPVPGA